MLHSSRQNAFKESHNFESHCKWIVWICQTYLLKWFAIGHRPFPSSSFNWYVAYLCLLCQKLNQKWWYVHVTQWIKQKKQTKREYWRISVRGSAIEWKSAYKWFGFVRKYGTRLAGNDGKLWCVATNLMLLCQWK